MRPARARMLLPLPDLRAMVVLRPARRILGINQHDRNVLLSALSVEAGTPTQKGKSWPNRLTSPNRPSTHWPHRTWATTVRPKRSSSAIGTAGSKPSTCAYESKRHSTTKRRKRISIISSEIEAQKQRDPSYIDSDLQWAWGRGYKAGASREITEEEIAAAMAETRKFITLPGAWMENIIRIAFDAARRKAMEE